MGRQLIVFWQLVLGPVLYSKSCLPFLNVVVVGKAMCIMMVDWSACVAYIESLV